MISAEFGGGGGGGGGRRGGGLNQVIFLLLFFLLFFFFCIICLFVRGSDFFGSLSLGVFPLLFWMVPLLVYFSSSLCPLFFSTLL